MTENARPHFRGGGGRGRRILNNNKASEGLFFRTIETILNLLTRLLLALVSSSTGEGRVKYTMAWTQALMAQDITAMELEGWESHAPTQRGCRSLWHGQCSACKRYHYWWGLPCWWAFGRGPRVREGGSDREILLLHRCLLSCHVEESLDIVIVRAAEEPGGGGRRGRRHAEASGSASWSAGTRGARTPPVIGVQAQG